MRDHDLPPVLAALEETDKEVADIDRQVLEIQQGAEYHTVANREKIKALNERKGGLMAGREDRQGQRGSIPGLASQARQLYALIAEKEAESERYIKVAEHAHTWEFREVEAVAADNEDDGPEASGNKV